jgi:NAD(P)-dependent dehydrogenase (short-subunit alcohol dehydrogenase family)
MTSYRKLFSLEGKIAVVTGGAGLIGREIVAALSDSGARVLIGDTDRDRAKELMQLTGAGFVQLDITSETSIEETLSGVVQSEGKLDILVNSAYPRTADWGAKLEDVPYDSWCTNLNSHLGGYFLCCRKGAELMKSGGGGSIINIASIYGVVAPDFSLYEGTEMTMPVAYSAIKGGVIAMTRYLATYYGSDKVRANVVSPGGIFDGQPESFVARYSAKTPMGRMGRADEIAGTVVYLASAASSFVTGQNLLVDGGWTAW